MIIEKEWPTKAELLGILDSLQSKLIGMHETQPIVLTFLKKDLVLTRDTLLPIVFGLINKFYHVGE